MEKVCVWIDGINVQLQLFKRKLGVSSCILNMLLLMKQLNLDVLTPGEPDISALRISQTKVN